MKKLTNTFKFMHRNEQNTNETSHSSTEEFHTLHALSLYNFIYGQNIDSLYVKLF
jgi:hypothetical protein